MGLFGRQCQHAGLAGAQRPVQESFLGPRWLTIDPVAPHRYVFAFAGRHYGLGGPCAIVVATRRDQHDVADDADYSLGDLSGGGRRVQLTLYECRAKPAGRRRPTAGLLGRSQFGDVLHHVYHPGPPAPIPDRQV